MWRARFFQSIPTILSEYPTARFIFLTLTVENCLLEELRETLKMMNAGWQRLIQLKSFPAIGFVRSTEVTRAEDDRAHPHFHALLMVRKSYFKKSYLSQEKWTGLWRDSVRLSYQPIVDVRTVTDHKSPDGLVEPLRSAILETLKYAVKPTDLIEGDSWLTEMTRQTHKLRFLATGGVLKDALGKIEPETNEELIRVSEETEVFLTSQHSNIKIFDWEKPVKRYRRNPKAE